MKPNYKNDFIFEDIDKNVQTKVKTDIIGNYILSKDITLMWQELLFLLEDKLGEGSYGLVRLATHTLTG